MSLIKPIILKCKTENIKTMKKILLAFLFVFVILSGNKEVKGQDQSLLWKITGNELEKPSYLYGTIHLICQDDFFMDDAVKQAFSNTDQVVLEIDFDDPNFAGDLQKNMVNPGNKNTSDVLNDDQKAILNTYFKQKYGADLSRLGMMRPFALLSMVIQKQITCDNGTVSYEMSFVQLAQQEEKDISGLETVEEQFALFDDIPIEDQYGWVVENIEDSVKMLEEYNALKSAYIQQDLDALFDVFIESEQFESYADALLYKRNANWIEAIEEFITEKSSFIAVGAGHLPSEKGVIALLRNAGYTVTPVTE